MEYVEIICILDKSGSMSSIQNDAIGGFNTFLREQQEIEGRVLFSLILFAGGQEKIIDRVNIRKVKELTTKTYRPVGSTALYDTIGTTIEESIDRLGNVPKEERPIKTLCVILTDGEENASRTYGWEDVNYHITEMREKFNWEFIYLGANQDAMKVAKTMGISTSNSMSYSADSEGISFAYNNISRAVASYRTEDKKEDLFK